MDNEQLVYRKLDYRTLNYRIPLYQRPYAWTAEQVRQLLDDLKNSKEKSKNSDYYIGIISVTKVEGKEIYDVIDGQQRLTTLMLIARQLKDDNNAKALKEFYNEGNRLDFYGRDEDKKYLRGDNNAMANQKMKDAVSVIDGYKNEHDLAKYIIEHAKLFVTVVPADYTLKDKNQYFVRMNNRGKQLEKYEILQARILSGIKIKEDKESTNEILDPVKIWAEVTGKIDGSLKNESPMLSEIIKPEFKSSEDSVTHLHNYKRIVDIETFLLIALKRYLKKEYLKEDVSFDKSKFLETFENLPKKDYLVFTENLKAQLDLLEQFFIFRTQTFDKPYEFLKPENSQEDYPERSHKLLMLQSFLYVSTPPQDWLIPAFDYLFDCLDKNSFDEKRFISELEKIARKRLWETIKSLDNLNMGTGTPHYVFYYLDYLLWKEWNKNGNGIWKDVNVADVNVADDVKKLITSFRFRTLGSVEHIVPQTNAANSQNQTDDTFSNLALISSSRNSKFSNYNIVGKREFIRDSGYSESLKMVHRLWGTEKAHGEAMWDLLSKDNQSVSTERIE